MTKKVIKNFGRRNRKSFDLKKVIWKFGSKSSRMTSPPTQAQVSAYGSRTRVEPTKEFQSTADRLLGSSESGPGYIYRLEWRRAEAHANNLTMPTRQSLTMEDDARPVGRRVTRNSYSRKGISRHVSVELPLTTVEVTQMTRVGHPPPLAF